MLQRVGEENGKKTANTEVWTSMGKEAKLKGENLIGENMQRLSKVD